MAVKRGTIGSDNLSGAASSDTIFGIGGNDTINGAGGDDFLFGGVGKDRLLGGAGNDQLGGGVGADTLLGGDGNDYLDGDENYSTFSFDQAGDHLDGGAGNDTFEAGINDTVIGGADIDTFRFSTFGAMPEVYRVDLRHVGDARAHAIGAAGSVLGRTFVGQVERTDVYLNDALGGSMMIGSSGADLLGAYISRPDNLSALAVNTGVTLAGGDGNDRLEGSSLDDTLSGGTGDDVVIGNDGNDKLSGGTGSDIFQFYLSTIIAETDVISDLSAPDDLLLFSANQLDFDFGAQNNLLLKAAHPTNATTQSGIAQFLYDTVNGRLYIDDNGSDAGGTTLLMILSNKANITAGNIVVEYDSGILL